MYPGVETEATDVALKHIKEEVNAAKADQARVEQACLVCLSLPLASICYNVHHPADRARRGTLAVSNGRTREACRHVSLRPWRMCALCRWIGQVKMHQGLRGRHLHTDCSTEPCSTDSSTEPPRAGASNNAIWAQRNLCDKTGTVNSVLYPQC